MKFIQGKDRNQTEFFCLDQAVSDDNEVRLIDLFVGAIRLSDYGFKMEFIENGRPAYHPSDLLKLFIYGYLNRIRSSRHLEKECKRNIELMWLMRGLTPDHNTIANFRKDNPKAIRKVFHATVSLAKNFDLIGGKLLAGDGTKLRAQNSKKNNFNEKKIERHIAYIDDKLNEYSTILASEDKDLSEEKKQEINDKIDKHQQHKDKYEEFKKQLDETGAVQISTSDPDSRQMIVRNNITEVAYNVQSTVDAKHNIPIDFKVTNKNDSKAMGAMVRRAKTILGHTDFTAIFDNYNNIALSIDNALKNKKMEWLVGDMPPFGNDANPWCNCQDNPDNYWKTLTIKDLKIENNVSTFNWTWGTGFEYKVKAIKSDNVWKISYLQGFDF